MDNSQDETIYCYCGSDNLNKKGHSPAKKVNMPKFKCKDCGKIFSQRIKTRVDRINEIIEAFLSDSIYGVSEICPAIQIHYETLNQNIESQAWRYQIKFAIRSPKKIIEKQIKIRLNKNKKDYILSSIYSEELECGNADVVEDYNPKLRDKELENFFHNKNITEYLSKSRSLTVCVYRFIFFMNMFYAAKKKHKKIGLIKRPKKIIVYAK